MCWSPSLVYNPVSDLRQVKEGGLSLQGGNKVTCNGELLGCKAFWEVLQGGGEPVLPVLGKAADVCQQTAEEHSQDSSPIFTTSTPKS